MVVDVGPVAAPTSVAVTHERDATRQLRLSVGDVSLRHTFATNERDRLPKSTIRVGSAIGSCTFVGFVCPRLTCPYRGADWHNARVRAQRSARRNWWEDRPIGSQRLRTSPESLRSAPGSSFGGLATIEPGSRDRPGDRSPLRSGGSHLPLRAGRNVLAEPMTPQQPYPRTSREMGLAYPRLSTGCGWDVDDPDCNIRATRSRRRFS